MTRHVALLRAVNVGGTGKLPMASLRAMGEACGFADVATYIASGNLLLTSDDGEAAIKAALEQRLADYAGKPVPVFVRSAAELAAIVQANPFPDAAGSRHMVYFGDGRPEPDLPGRCRDRADERIAIGTRELHIDYGEGISQSRLKIPGGERLTARNMNTVRTLAELCEGGTA